MRILITGAQGYIGTRLLQTLDNSKHEVIATDIGYFKDCLLHDYKDPYKINFSDLRNFNYELLQGVEAIIHLGALSNDPLGDFDDSITYDINHISTVKLAENAKKYGVKKFLFSSSCIMYGSSQSNIVDENSSLDPKTAYAVSKVRAEKDIFELTSDNFSVISIRNGTVFGYSPRMRFDTVLNSFILSIIKNNKIQIFGDGSPWRPVVHIDDLCRSIILFLEAKTEIVRGQAFNNGSDDLNITIRNLAEGVTSILGANKLEILDKENADKRTYKASFAKFKNTFPSFHFENLPIKSSKDVFAKLLEYRIEIDEYQHKFIRLNSLKNQLNSKRLNKKLKLI